MLRARDFLYWALMGLLATLRFLLCWFFLVGSLCALGVLGKNIRDLIVLYPDFTLPSLDRAKAFLLTAAILNGVAWWTTSRSSPRHREWATAACLLMLLGVAFLVAMNPNSPEMLNRDWPLALIGAVGLAAYLPPWRLRPEVKISAYRRKSPTQEWQGALVWLLAVGRFVGTLTYGLAFILTILGIRDELAGPSMHLAAEVTLTAVVGFLSGAAWWMTMLNRPSQRIWAITNSLIYFVPLVLIVIIESSDPHFRHVAWAILLPVTIGLVAYLLPYRLRYSVDIFSYRLKSPGEALKQIHASL
ncbi:MAG TPA: hypothetical protein VMD55_01050 [Terracidiphilus sp.]|nr:hypothetical protein [Terracidiphilus sp.]